MLPLSLGSLHVTWIEVAVDDARTDVTGPGLLGGVTHDEMALNGPAPALFTAYRMQLQNYARLQIIITKLHRPQIQITKLIRSTVTDNNNKIRQFATVICNAKII